LERGKSKGERAKNEEKESTISIFLFSLYYFPFPLFYFLFPFSFFLRFGTAAFAEAAKEGE